MWLMEPSVQISVSVCLKQGHSKGHCLELPVSITEVCPVSLYIATDSHLVTMAAVAIRCVLCGITKAEHIDMNQVFWRIEDFNLH